MFILYSHTRTGSSHFLDATTTILSYDDSQASAHPPSHNGIVHWQSVPCLALSLLFFSSLLFLASLSPPPLVLHSTLGTLFSSSATPAAQALTVPNFPFPLRDRFGGGRVIGVSGVWLFASHPPLPACEQAWRRRPWLPAKVSKATTTSSPGVRVIAIKSS